MADSTTLRYGLVKPEVSASTDTWGVKFNADLDALDNIIYAIRTDLTALQAQVAANTSAVTTNRAAFDQYVTDHTFPSGAIAMWKGSVASIPTGWVLCDGGNGAPDLRNSFIVGAGSTYSPLATGGNVSQTPTITIAGTAITIAQMPSHNHGYYDPGHAHPVYDGGHTHGYIRSNIGNAGGFNAGSGGNQGGYSDSTNGANANVSIGAAAINISIYNNGGSAAHNHGATSSTIDVRPPYVSLCYIMKI